MGVIFVEIVGIASVSEDLPSGVGALSTAVSAIIGAIIDLIFVGGLTAKGRRAIQEVPEAETETDSL